MDDKKDYQTQETPTMKLKFRTTGGEGETARDALEALAHGLRDREIDDAGGKITIEIKRATIRSLGDETSYEGFEAVVVASR